METVTEQHEHCWHESGQSHMSYPAQLDQVCCHCGARKRMRQELVTPEGHGPHAPKVARWVIDVDARVPRGTVQFRDGAGRVTGEIVNIGAGLFHVE